MSIGINRMSIDNNAIQQTLNSPKGPMLAMSKLQLSNNIIFQQLQNHSLNNKQFNRNTSKSQQMNSNFINNINNNSSSNNISNINNSNSQYNVNPPSSSHSGRSSNINQFTHYKNQSSTAQLNSTSSSSLKNSHNLQQQSQLQNYQQQSNNQMQMQQRQQQQQQQQDKQQQQKEPISHNLSQSPPQSSPLQVFNSQSTKIKSLIKSSVELKQKISDLEKQAKIFLNHKQPSQQSSSLFSLAQKNVDNISNHNYMQDNEQQQNKIVSNNNSSTKPNPLSQQYQQHYQLQKSQQSTTATQSQSSQSNLKQIQKIPLGQAGAAAAPLTQRNSIDQILTESNNRNSNSNSQSNNSNNLTSKLNIKGRVNQYKTNNVYNNNNFQNNQIQKGQFNNKNENNQNNNLNDQSFKKNQNTNDNINININSLINQEKSPSGPRLISQSNQKRINSQILQKKLEDYKKNLQISTKIVYNPTTPISEQFYSIQSPFSIYQKQVEKSKDSKQLQQQENPQQQPVSSSSSSIKDVFTPISPFKSESDNINKNSQNQKGLYQHHFQSNSSHEMHQSSQNEHKQQDQQKLLLFQDQTKQQLDQDQDQFNIKKLNKSYFQQSYDDKEFRNALNLLKDHHTFKRESRHNQQQSNSTSCAVNKKQKQNYNYNKHNSASLTSKSLDKEFSLQVERDRFLLYSINSQHNLDKGSINTNNMSQNNILNITDENQDSQLPHSKINSLKQLNSPQFNRNMQDRQQYQSNINNTCKTSYNEKSYDQEAKNLIEKSILNMRSQTQSQSQSFQEERQEIQLQFQESKLKQSDIESQNSNNNKLLGFHSSDNIKREHDHQSKQDTSKNSTIVNDNMYKNYEKELHQNDFYNTKDINLNKYNINNEILINMLKQLQTRLFKTFKSYQNKEQIWIKEKAILKKMIYEQKEQLQIKDQIISDLNGSQRKSQ